MAKLVYDFSVVGAKNVERAFAGIERRATQHNLRMSRALGGGTGAAGRRAPKLDTAARAAQQIERRSTAERIRNEKRVAAEAAKTAKQQEAAARKLHRLRVRQGELDRKFARKQRAEAKKAAEAVVRERRRTTGALFGRAGRSAGGALRAVGGVAAGALAIGGSVAMGSAISQQITETRMASQLANQAGQPGMKRQILKEAQGVRGFTGQEVMTGMGSFMDLTGDLEGARRMMKDLAQITLATGASFEDMTALAANMSNSLSNIEDPGERAAKVMETIRGLARQGELGAVEVKDMASMGGRLSALSTGISGDKSIALRKAGALTQVAKRAAGDPRDAMTAAENFIDNIAAKYKIIEKKLKIKDAFEMTEDGARVAVRDPQKLIGDIMERTGGDIGMLGKILGKRGQRVTRAFADIYKAKDRAGIDEMFSGYVGATMSQGEVAQRAASRLADPDLQFKEVVRDFNAQVGQELLPVVTKLIPEFAKLLPHVVTAARIFGKIVDNLITSPLMTIGSLIAARVVMDVAAAQIGSGIKSALTDAIAGKDGSGGAGVTGKSNIGGAMLNGLTIGAAAALTIYASGVVNFEAGEAKMDRMGQLLKEARGLDLSTEAGRTRLQELSGEQQRITDAESKPGMVENLIAGLYDFFGTASTAGPALGYPGAVPAPKQLTESEKIAGAKGITSEFGFGNQVVENTALANEEEYRKLRMEAARYERETAEKNASNAEKMRQAAELMKNAGAGMPARPKQGT